MKNQLLILTLLFAYIGENLAADNVIKFPTKIYDFIENQSVFELNQEPGRSYYIPEKSLLLNGDWKFNLYNIPEKAPADFFEPYFSDESWNVINVPSNWEMLGFSDKLFRNVALPFIARPPHVPREYNPCGCYRKIFSVPQDWNGNEVFLRLEKMASAGFVWLNGHFIGYNEGAHEPSEYNITDFLRKGNNVLAVAVLKYSDGYYLEDQDYWRFSGIFDDVTIYSTPSLRLFDWQVITLCKGDKEWKLDLNSTIVNYDRKNTDKSVYIKAVLSDDKGKKVGTLQSDELVVDTDGSFNTGTSITVDSPRLWSAETPNLYTLSINLIDKLSDKIIDKADIKIGFKETIIKDGVFFLNNVPIKVNAMNSHMQHPVTGHYVNEHTIRKDFEILKKFNFNAVRTSHYPPTPKYLELANEYGIYIIDEAGTEAHATEWLSEDTTYIPMYLERVEKMVLRDRNYPCVLFWSAGNESGEGENITSVIEYGKELDPSRYWMYGGNAYSHHAEDIVGPRYPLPLEHEVGVGLLSHENKIGGKPSFMDEYLSVAGNAGGGMDEYWDNIYRYDNIIGGAIWDFVSVGLKEKVRIVSDKSDNNIICNLMGGASIVREDDRQCLLLNGHDQWLEVYRDEKLDIDNDALTLYIRVKPGKLQNASNSFITKGSNQFGIKQYKSNTLSFYVFTDKKYEIDAPLPLNWYGSWHDVLATLVEGKIKIYVDKVLLAEKNIGEGCITNFPFSLNIGKDAEADGQETSSYLCDALFSKVIVWNKEFAGDWDMLEEEEKNSLLWLEFDKTNEAGYYFDYGIGARTYGSIWPDRTIQPEMYQFKHSTQPIDCSAVDSDRFLLRFTNRNSFLNASSYDNRWTLQENGKKVLEGKLRLDIPALSEKNIDMSKIIHYKFNNDKEYHILIQSFLKENTLWAKKGHEVAWNQILLKSPIKILEKKQNLSSSHIKCKDENEELIIDGDGFSYIFSKKDCNLSSMKINNNDVLTSGPELNIWRAPIANDLDGWNFKSSKSVNWKPQMGKRIAAEFYSMGIDETKRIPLDFSYTINDDGVSVYVRELNLFGRQKDEVMQDLYVLSKSYNGIINEYEYFVSNDGTLTIEHKLSLSGEMPLYFPRVGLSFNLSNSMNTVQWYGRGPQENYPDRKTGYMIGDYSSKVDDMFEPYLIPQDCGLRTDNRWVKLVDDDGIGLMIEQYENIPSTDNAYMIPFNFNIYSYSTDNLDRALYPFQLEKTDYKTLNVDYETSGVGCTCRGIFSDYKVRPKTYNRTIRIVPLR